MKNTLTYTIGGFAVLAIAATAPAALAQEAGAMPHAHSSSANQYSKLIAAIRPVGDSKVRGTIEFTRMDDGIHVLAKIGGLTPDAKHAIHIHEFGDLGSDDATSAGGHFNPDNHPHAMPDKEERHSGDLGNLEADSEGNATLRLTVKNITLDLGPRGILGRAVIVHAKADDGGQPTGNAGDRIGAGVIGLSKDAMKDPGKKTEPKEPDTAADTATAE